MIYFLQIYDMETTMNWEFSVLYFLQQLHNPVMDSVMVFFTKMGNIYMPWLAIAAVMLCFKKLRPCGIAIILSLLCKELIGNMLLKNLVARQRPCWIDTTIPLLVSSPSSFSFPSGHTFDGFAASVSVFLYSKKLGIAAIIVAAIIAFSRLYLFVHFPTDVLASVVLGTFVAVIVHHFIEKYRGKNILKINRTK